MKIVGMFRIKDGIQFIDEFIEQVSKFCDEIVICDNGSIDGTFEKYKEYPIIKDIFRTEGYDEGRDRILLHILCKLRQPDWIIWIDVDEIFEPTINRMDIEREILEAEKDGCDALGFERYHFWMGRKNYRIDERWKPRIDRFIFRNDSQKYFLNIPVHAGIVQGINKFYVSKFRLKHYGHITTILNKEKQYLYRKVDNPNGGLIWTGRDYKHMDENRKDILLAEWKI